MPESGTMRQAKGKGIARSAGWTLLTFLLLMPANLLGQTGRPLTIEENARFSASASSSYQFKSGLDRGGEVSIAHYGVRVGGAAPLSDRNWLGLSLSYDREEYNFSNAGGFAVSNPWSQINRLGLGLWFKYRLNDK